jgi:ElaA protein
MAEAMRHIGPGREVVLDAQTGAVGLYERFGFAVCGPAYLEDGIEHVPMRRPVAGG